MDNYIDQFKYYLRLERGVAENTIVSYIYDLEKFQQFLGSGTHISKAQENDVRSFIYFVSEYLSAASQARIISSLNHFYSFLILQNILENNPVTFIELPKKVKKLPTVLTVEEVDLLLLMNDLNTNEGRRNCAMVETLYSCGLRVSELISLRLSDLYFEEGFIKVLGKG